MYRSDSDISASSSVSFQRSQNVAQKGTSGNGRVQKHGKGGAYDTQGGTNKRHPL